STTTYIYTLSLHDALPIYLVILARHQGRDEYREQLQSLSEELNVADHVRFINKYVSLDDLVKYVAISDFYLTPYIDPQQVTSGRSEEHTSELQSRENLVCR